MVTHFNTSATGFSNTNGTGTSMKSIIILAALIGLGYFGYREYKKYKEKNQ
jgi:hypothetical protein